MTTAVGIVHGDDLIRSSLAARLDRAKYRVYATGDAQEMRTWLGRKRIDIVLVGLRSLGREALALVEAVTAAPRQAASILINDGGDISLAIAAMKAGAYDEITPPFDLRELEQRINGAWAAVKARRTSRTRRSPLARARELMVAISFAEAGEAEIAQSIMEGDSARPRGDRSQPDSEPSPESVPPRRG